MYMAENFEFKFSLVESNLTEAEKWSFKSKIWKPKISSFVI